MPKRAAPARAYCTIFNSLYLVRGLALLESLVRHDPDHRVYVFAMDESTASVLERRADSRVVVIRQGEFEPQELLDVRPKRTVAEYFWTCTPQIIRHCIAVRGEPECTYVDADVWLLASPQPLFDEMVSASVLLTEHRYATRYDAASSRGRFCVQFMRFVADPDGRRALDWWCERCIEWCHARLEEGRFGDQKYLDDWPTRFEGVHISSHIGGGVAPWNAERTKFRGEPEAVEVCDIDGSAWRPLIFYHFHGLASYADKRVCFASGYRLPRDSKRLVYRPYVRELSRLYVQARPSLSGTASAGIAPGASNSGRGLRAMLRRLRGLPNTERLPAAV